MSSIPNTMQAAVFHQYGGAEVVKVEPLPVPQPAPGQVLIRVRAASVNPGDLAFRSGQFKAFASKKFPKTFGYDVAGEVAALGAGVSGFKVGDRVYGMSMDFNTMGAFAQYVPLKAEQIAPMPAALSFNDAAAIPLAAQTALQGLRDEGGLQAGDRVLINGASGGVGLFAVQIAKAMGAHVTAVTSGKNADLVREYGADAVIDYTRQPITADQPFAVVFDGVGNLTFAKARPMLTPAGRFVSIVPNAAQFLQGFFSRRFGKGRVRLFLVKSRSADLHTLGEWVKAGKLRVYLDAVYPLEQIGAAQEHVASRRARGKVGVTVG